MYKCFVFNNNHLYEESNFLMEYGSIYIIYLTTI